MGECGENLRRNLGFIRVSQGYAMSGICFRSAAVASIRGIVGCDGQNQPVTRASGLSVEGWVELIGRTRSAFPPVVKNLLLPHCGSLRRLTAD
jgi:hypothetical protein